MARDRFVTFEDTIKADSEREATEAIYRLYPSATDIELLSRERADGTASPSGRYFVFEVTLEQEEEFFEEAPEDLGEEEY